MRIFYWFGVLVFVWLHCVKKAIWDFNHFLYRLITNPSLQPHSHSLLIPGPSWGLYGASQVVLVVKKLPAKARDTGDAGSVPGSRRSPGGGHGHPLQYSCLENPMDGRASWTTKQSRQRGKHPWRVGTHLALGLCGVSSLVLCVFHYRYLAISILSLQTFGDASRVYLSGFFFSFYGLTVILGGFGGRWRQMHMYQSSILKLNMRTQRSIEKF